MVPTFSMPIADAFMNQPMAVDFGFSLPVFPTAWLSIGFAIALFLVLLVARDTISRSAHTFRIARPAHTGPRVSRTTHVPEPA
jgi:hypothetical protein